MCLGYNHTFNSVSSAVLCCWIDLFFFCFFACSQTCPRVCGAVTSNVCQIKEISKDIKRFWLSDLKGLRKGLLKTRGSITSHSDTERQGRPVISTQTAEDLTAEDLTAEDLHLWCLICVRNTAERINKKEISISL